MTPDALDLAAARRLAVEDATAGLTAAACPYPTDRPLERHVYLAWMTRERLTLAGFRPDEES